MANDGKIIIDTKLDTSGFEKDVDTASKKVADGLGKGVDKAMKQAESSINNVGKAAKNIDFSKIPKQLENVSKSIEETSTQLDKQKEKLENLKKAYENATNVKDQNKISSQMEKAEASITKLETKLNNLNNKKISLDSAKDTINGLDGNFSSASMSVTKSIDNIKKKVEEAEKSFKNFSAAESISKTGKLLSNVGDSFTRNVTAPVTLFGTIAAKVGMDFDAQMSRVKAISGATGEEFKQLHDQALQLGKDTAFSAKQAAEGMENLAAAGFNTQETMAAMPGLLDLAAASGESLATSSDIAASTLRGFGLEANQAGHVADVLAKNANATNAAVADTGEAMKYIAPVAHSMGLSLEEVTAAIGEMANSGIKGSQAGTTLRSALTRLASPSDEAAGAMESIGFNAFNSQGKLKSLSTIVEEYSKALKGKTEQQQQDLTATIFGQEAMSGMLVLMQGGKKGLDDLTESYKNSDGAAKDMATTMQDNAKSAIEQMTGSIETAAIKLEEAAAPAITKIAGEVQDMANRFADLPEPMQESIIKTALFAAAIGPLMKTVGTVTSNIGRLIKLGGTLGKTLGLIGTGAEAGEAALAGFSLAGGLASGAASALVVGIAGAVTYHELLNKSVNTSAEDLNVWERAVNACTGGVVKSKVELQKAGLVYKEFGEGVSDNFKEGIEKATKQYHDFEMTLTGENSGEKISEEGKKKISNAIDSMIDGAKTAINKRKSEIQSELSKMFNEKGGIDSGEQAVLDEAGKASDEKLKQVEDIQGKISDVWTKAIQEHGKLSQEDVETIENYLQQVKQIQAEVEAKNTAESDFTKNQFGERLKGISAEDATKEYQSASQDLSKSFADARATYKTGLDELANMEKQAEEAGETARAESYKKQIEDKKKEYDDLINVEKSKRREYLNMLYEKNPSLEGNLNEVDGTMFSKADRNTQGDLYKIKQEFSEVAEATESGMKRVKDANGQWHDIEVTVDQSTGNITSAYDTFTGKYGGYSKKFADDAKASGDKIKEAMENMQKALMPNGGGIKLDSNNNAINASSDELIEKLDNVIKKADGTRTAVENINGTKIKLEFDEDGTLKNAQDVEDALNGKFKDNPAVIQTKVTIDGQEADSTTEDIIKKLNDIKESNPNAKISINGEEIPTIDEAIEKLSNVPPDTNTDVRVETGQATQAINNTENNLSELDEEKATPEVEVDAGNSFSIIDRIKSFFNWITGRKATATVDVNANTGDPTPRYTGTSGGSDSLITKDEHGWEMTTGENELYYLGGGTGILDHGSSVNAMKKDVSNAVDSRFGVVVNKLLSAMSSQNNLLGNISSNTKESAKNGIQLNEKLANGVINQMNSTTGSFTGLEQQIRQAQYAVDNANIMSIDNNEAYAKAKAELDRLNNLTSNERKALGDDEYQRQKDYAEKVVETAKQAAELEIEVAKNTAKQKQEIAEQNKNALTKIAEATTTAIKNQLTKEKEAAEKVINDELSNMEKSYNKKVEALENRTKSKSDKLDKQIAELEQQSTDDSRSKERTDANNNINVLKTKMANTASEADKRAIALEIKDAQNELKEKEDAWDIEDQKAALEKEKSLLSEKEDNEKKSLEKEYTRQKEAKQKELKNVDAYYDKLLETDSINAQARYRILNDSQQELVNLLNSYAPKWQDSGQSLADSLINGLNSQQTSTEDAVRNLISIRSSRSSSSNSTGYASGTSYNPYAGLYNVDENNKFEVASSADAVAYVSKGAAIKNHMQSEQFIQSEIAKQVGLMKSAVMQSQMEMARSLGGLIAKTTNTNNKTEIYKPTLQIQNYHQHTNMDAEQLADEFNVMAYKQKKA